MDHSRRFGWLAWKLGTAQLTLALESLKESIVARLDPIINAAGAISDATDAIASEVAKVAEQLAAGGVSDEEIAAAAETLGGIATRLSGVRDSVDALVEVAGEDDAVPPPAPENPTTPDNT